MSARCAREKIGGHLVAHRFLELPYAGVLLLEHVLVRQAVFFCFADLGLLFVVARLRGAWKTADEQTNTPTCCKRKENTGSAAVAAAAAAAAGK